MPRGHFESKRPRCDRQNRRTDRQNQERDDLLEYREKVKRWKSFNKKLDINNLEYITSDLLEFYGPATPQFEPPKHLLNGRRPVVGLLCDDIQSIPLKWD